MELLVMAVIKNTTVGRFNTNVSEVMDHVRKPVFVDNAIHHARIDTRATGKSEVTIEKSNVTTFQVTPERKYTSIERESALQISHFRTPGHRYTGNPFFQDGVLSDTNQPYLIYDSDQPSSRLLPSTNEASSIGRILNLKNMKNRTISDIGFSGSAVHFGQPIDVGLRTTDLAMKVGKDVVGDLASLNIGLPRKPSNTNKTRKMHTTKFLGQDFNGVNLKTALKFISRHDSRMVLLDKFGNLLYIPYKFSETSREVPQNLRMGGNKTDPVDDLPNRVAVKGRERALNDVVYALLDDGEKQSGEEGEIIEAPDPIVDLSVSTLQGARRVARQILKANSLSSGAMKSDGHFALTDLRPGMSVNYKNDNRVISEARHYLHTGLSDIVMLNIDTGLEGVLQGIQEGAVVSNSATNPVKSTQQQTIELGFFGRVNVNITAYITQQGVASTGLLLGGVKGTKQRGMIGKSGGLPIGRNKGQRIVVTQKRGA